MFSTIRKAGAAFGVVALLAASATAVSASTPHASKDAPSAALVPSSIKASGLNVATDATYAPDEYVDGNGHLTGFNVELINAIGTTLGVRVTNQNVTFDNILSGIKSGHYNVGNSSFTDNKTRQAIVNFVDYFQAGEGFYGKSSAKNLPKKLSALCGVHVAVETGTVEESDAHTQSKACAKAKKSAVMIDTFSTQTDANLAVSSGHDAVGFVDSQIAGYIVSKSAGAFKLSGAAFGVAPYGIATAKTTDGLNLAKAIQSALKVLIKNGVYGSILNKYGVSSGGFAEGKIQLNAGK